MIKPIVGKITIFLEGPRIHVARFIYGGVKPSDIAIVLICAEKLRPANERMRFVCELTYHERFIEKILHVPKNVTFAIDALQACCDECHAEGEKLLRNEENA